VALVENGAVPLAMALVGGVTKRSALWRCSPLRQRTKPATQARAASRLSKPFSGHEGTYLQVRKIASENGLSLLTRGRLKLAEMWRA